MRAAVGLQVEAHDLDRADLLDALGQQVDLRADEVRDRERLRAWQQVDPDVAPRRSSSFTVCLDLADEVAGHALELEVHPAPAGLHVAARDEGAVVAPHDAAQGVEAPCGCASARSGAPSRGRP